MRLLVIFFFLASVSLNGQETSALFIGNSYTYFWNLPQVVSAMGKSTGDDIWTQQSTAGGSTLGQHWRNERNIKSHEILASKSWDYVVLQDHSLRSINEPDSLHFYLNHWIDEIHTQGSKPILYMTWARVFDPTMIDVIAPAYEAIAAKRDVAIVPAGKIWAMAIQRRPDIILYDPDGSHPSPLGTYLTACAFYSTITGKPSKGLPARLISKDAEGEHLFLMVVSPEDAQYCQSIVDHILSTYGKD